MRIYAGKTKEDFLQDCQCFAESKGGRCLSVAYVSTHDKLLWECEFGHTWEAMPSNVKRGKWCPVCAGNKQLTIEDCIEFARLKDGCCLSTEYENSAALLVWQCSDGHTWTANFNNIKSKNSWCPICSSNIGEQVCRHLFEQFFGQSFVKSRPSWLINDDGNRLELDGFNETLKIAFEYQGTQHYEIDGFFIKSAEQLHKRQRDDFTKKILCNDHQIALIEISQFEEPINFDAAAKLVSAILLMNGFIIDQDLKVDIVKLYSGQIIKYKTLAAEKGGRCLSDVYLGYYTKLIWQCEKEHVWEAAGYTIEQGHWCPDCAGNRKGGKYPGFKSDHGESK